MARMLLNYGSLASERSGVQARSHHQEVQLTKRPVWRDFHGACFESLLFGRTSPSKEDWKRRAEVALPKRLCIVGTRSRRFVRVSWHHILSAFTNFYGTIIAGAARLMGWERFCGCGH